MRKILCIIAVTAIALMGCGSNANDERLSQLEEQNKKLQSEVESLTKSSNSPQTSAPTPESTPEATKPPVPPAPQLSKHEKEVLRLKKIKVKVFGKKLYEKNIDIGRYSDFVEFKIKVTNNTGRTIKGIKGSLSIYDQFGDLIKVIGWNFEKTIKNGNYILDTEHGFDCNQFMDEDIQIRDAKFSKLKFEYDIEQVNYANGKKVKA